MSNIPASLVKELRDETNVGMMECKKALADAGGDKAKAIKLLRERGVAIAAKKASRVANQGVIAASILDGGRVGGLVEVNCETDFVAKNEKFLAFAKALAEKAARGEGGADLASHVKADVAAKVAEIGENIVLRRAARFDLQGCGLVVSYIHHNSALGVMAECGCGRQETASSPAFMALAEDICLQIAASSPRYVDRAAVPADVIAAERAIFAKQVENKPANIVEKIVDGKIGKFFEQVCLVDQPFWKDEKKRVSDLLKAISVELKDEIIVRRFVRFQRGETA